MAKESYILYIWLVSTIALCVFFFLNSFFIIIFVFHSCQVCHFGCKQFHILNFMCARNFFVCCYCCRYICKFYDKIWDRNRNDNDSFVCRENTYTKHEPQKKCQFTLLLWLYHDLVTSWTFISFAIVIQHSVLHSFVC